MNGMSVVFSMTASAYLTTAFICAFLWWRQRDAWAHFLFGLAALAAAAFVWCDRTEMLADSPAQFASTLRWANLAVWVIVLSLAGFVRLYFRAGRTWLLWTVCGLQTGSLLLNFTTGQNLIFHEITGLSHMTILGESVGMAKGVPNPWILVGLLSLLTLAIFVLDASLAVWRRGDRRLATLVGGSIVFFVLAGSAETALIIWGNVQWPLTPSLFYLAVVAAMAYEVVGEAQRSAQLDRDLQVRDQQLALAAEAAGMGFWYCDYAREDFWASNEWRALFGFTSSETLYIDKFLQRLDPNDRELTLQALDNAYKGDGSYQAEHRLLMPDGQIRWIACQGRLELNSDRQPARLQGVSLDITRRKLAELEVHTQRHEVAHLLRTASLGELSSALAHELRQPLTAILSNAQAAQRFLARDDLRLHVVREILSDIVADDKRAADVIDRLHVLMKKGEFQPQPLAANELIRDVIRLMHHELMGRSVRVVTDLTPGLPPMRGDRVQLQQVLINLILNAEDAMSHPIKDDRTLTLRSDRMGESEIRISVADTGPGIPPGGEERIFESYYTTKPQGLGLGLSLGRSILIEHGGRLWAENSPSGGAVFHFTVPECKDDSHAEAVARRAS